MWTNTFGSVASVTVHATPLDTPLATPPATPPPVTPASSSGLRLPANTIFCTQTIKQVAERVPVPEEKWVGYLVPPLWRRAVLQHGCVHIVGDVPDRRLLVAVSERDAQHLCTSLGGSLESADSIDDCFQPTPAQERVHLRKAKKRSQQTFIHNASRGICRGLDDFYRQVQDSHIKEAIEWMILLRDIEVSPDDTRKLFFRYCLFVFDHVRRPWDDSSTLENFGGEEWIKDLREQKAALPEEVALLRGLLECAGGKSDDKQHRRLEGSVNDNLAILGKLFGVNARKPVRFSRFKEKLLLQYGPLNIEALYRLIGFREELHGILPPVANALPSDSVAAVMETIHELYVIFPCPRDGSDSLLLLSCCMGHLDGHYPAICRWTRSKEGQQWYDEVRRLERTRSEEQEALDLTALTAYEYFFGSVDKAEALNVYICFTEELMSRVWFDRRQELWKHRREEVERKAENEESGWEVEESGGSAEDGESEWDTDDWDSEWLLQPSNS